MNSTFKVILALAALLAVVFGVTFISQYTLTDPAPGGKKPEAGAAAGNEPPLRFFSTTAKWDPTSESLADRTFPGFYEPGAEGKAAFWFENRNPQEVVLQLKHISCSACSRGKVSAIPPETTRLLFQMTAVAGLPLGPVSALPLGLAAPAALLRDDALNGTELAFKDHPQAAFTVPAAAATPDPWAPQWGILELGFTAREPKESRTLTSGFATAVKGTDKVGGHEFALHFQVVGGFTATPTEINVGELTDDSPARTYDVTVFSLTRSPDDPVKPFPPPAASVRVPLTHRPLDGPDRFVTVGPVTPVAGPDLAAFEERFAREGGRGPVTVRGAYRATVTVNRAVGGDQLDIGPLERDVYFALGEESVKVPLRGNVRGGVWLTDGGVMDLKNFSGRQGVTTPFSVTTERPDAELAFVADQTVPDFLGIKLTKLPAVGDRGAYRLVLTVPPGRQFGPLPANAAVVLEIKGPKPQRVRLPLKGSGGFN